MSPATAIKPPPPLAVEPTKLERLHRERFALTGKLASLNASAARLREAVALEATVREEINALSRADAAALTQWATNGGQGDVPTPDPKLRRALAERLASTSSQAAAAIGATQDLDHQIRELTETLSGISEAIERAALDVLEGEFYEIVESYTAAVEHENKLTAKLAGMRAYLSEEGRRLSENGNPDAGRLYFTRSSAMAALKLIERGATKAEIIGAAADWSRRASTLRRGSPS